MNFGNEGHLSKYFRMLNAGIPIEAIRLRMTQDGIDRKDMTEFPREQYISGENNNIPHISANDDAKENSIELIHMENREFFIFDEEKGKKLSKISFNDTEDSLATDRTIAEIINNDLNDLSVGTQQSENISIVSKKKNFFTLKMLDFLINDLLIVFISISDVFFDIAVCRQFYLKGQFTFFYISLVIFCFAQFSYCFLFTATWGKELSPCKKMIVFLCVLPIGQLIPFFTWIEALRFSWLDSFIIKIGLRPTAAGGSAREEERQDLEQQAGGDMLWGYIQTKYQSHAGFLAEALAEAIPQCVLQTVSLIMSGEPSILFIISITISICVISSKGYLISYSIHRPTFIFNFLCIAADIFGLFATCAWLFHSDGGGILESFSSDTFLLPSDHLEAIWVVLFLSGCFLLVLGGLCLVVFSMLDDHLKTYDERMWGNLNISNVFFDLYFVRVLAWIVAVIPVCVVFLTSKLTLIPVCLFNSLDPEHAQHFNFYSSLFRFLKLFKTDMRIAETNKFIIQCRRDVPKLSRAMKHQNIEWDYGRRRTPAERKVQEMKALQNWLINVGKPEEETNAYIPQVVTVEPEIDLELQEAIARAIAESFDDTTARAAVRSVHVNHAMLGRYGRMKRELSKRSAIFYDLFNDRNNPPRIVHAQYDNDSGCFKLFKKSLFFVGMFFMWIGLIATALLVPCFLAATVVGVLFPIIQFLRSLSTSSDINILRLFLTISYIILIFVLLCMIPFVGEFQLFRTDIVDLTGFPPIFYEIDTVKELHRRFVLEIDARLFEKTLDVLFGMDVALHIRSFVDPSGHAATDATLKTYAHRIQSVSR